MKSFDVGSFVFLNDENHRMHRCAFKIISKVRQKDNTWQYCIDHKGRKLFVNKDSLYLVDDVQLPKVKQYLRS